MRIGVLSDTHGHLEPSILEIFQGVEHILHAGDIGLPWLILELESIAPVTAVLGNTDDGLSYRETENVILHGRKFLLHHIVDVNAPGDKLQRLVRQEDPDVVVFGHTHRRFCAEINGILYFNPGYAGKAKGDAERSVAILTCDDQGTTADYFFL